MSKCDNCRLRKETAQAFDIHWHGQEDCPYDVCPEIKTNGDRIRAMSDEELADFLRGFNGMCETHCPFGECGIHSLSCRDLAIKWLKQEAEDG